MTGAIARPEFTSQGTQIEQARATADVLAAVEAAKRWPRDLAAVKEEMSAVCKTERVAKTAFWSFPRGKEDLTGSSVYLMRTIAAIWGNCSFGARELNRDPRRELSEMHAWAWDLQSNVRIEETFLVPWAIDLKGDKTKRLVALRDIRELLSNVAQRKVRVQIRNMLPDWYVADAEDTALAIIEQRGVDIEKVRHDTGQLLAPMGIPLANVLYRVGRADWNDTTRGDLAVLRIAAASIERGESTITELFPPPPVRRAVSTPEADARPVGDHAPVDTPDVDTAPPVTKETQFAMTGLFQAAGLGGKTDTAKAKRLRVSEILTGRTLLRSTDLTEADGQTIVSKLGAAPDVKVYVDKLLADDQRERKDDVREATPDDASPH